jgi:nucleotidyltransferase/DNA polymerase involved in DNA repair
MAKLTPLLQPLSIDEAALDLAGTEALHGAPPAVVLARFVRDVEATVGVTAARRHRCWHPSPVRLCCLGSAPPSRAGSPLRASLCSATCRC